MSRASNFKSNFTNRKTMNQTERLQQTPLVELCQPTSNKHHMKRRMLTNNMITVHNKPSSRSVTLNRPVSEEAFVKDMKYAYVLTGGDNGNEKFLVLAKDNNRPNEGYKISYNTRNGQCTATICYYKIVKSISEHFGLVEGDYYFNIVIESDYGSDYVIMKLTDIIESQPLPGKQTAAIPHRNEILMTTPELPEKLYTARELWEALKRLGYSGAISKTETLD